MCEGGIDAVSWGPTAPVVEEASQSYSAAWRRDIFCVGVMLPQLRKRMRAKRSTMRRRKWRSGRHVCRVLANPST